jgi:hypothetical protein
MNITRIFNSIIIFIIIIAIIFILKPSFIFKENGEMKPFGVNSEKGQTIFHFGVVSSVIAIISFWIVSVKDYTDSITIEEMKIIEQIKSINELDTF